MHNLLTITTKAQCGAGAPRSTRAVLGALAAGTAALALTACATDVGAESPAPAPDANPAAAPAAVAANEATPQGHFASAPGWAMPEPALLQPSISEHELFKACDEIPDEVLTELKLEKASVTWENRPPFQCGMTLKDDPSSGGALTVSAYQYSIDQMISAGTLDFEEELPQYPKAAVGRPGHYFTEVSCAALVETERGTIMVSYTNVLGHSDKARFCDIPTGIALKLFGEDSNA